MLVTDFTMFKQWTYWNCPDRVIKHNNNFIEGSYGKEAISSWKARRTGIKKPKTKPQKNPNYKTNHNAFSQANLQTSMKLLE